MVGSALSAHNPSRTPLRPVNRESVRKILIANRGEIAVRVIRAAREAGLASVAVYSDCDRAARHVRMADEAWPLGGNRPADSYLRIDRLIDVARRSGADAVHPGYGFLAENADFAAACRDAGPHLHRPDAGSHRADGQQDRGARGRGRAPAWRSVPGTTTPLPTDAPESDVLAIAAGIGYPLMLKAVAGGGGKGMRTVAAPADLPSALRAARSEAMSAFGDGAVYLERRLERPRHIEVQLLGDAHGTVVPFVERECSIQRRHQKVLEESPSPAVSPELRASLGEAARKVAASVGYTNAGTIEFLLDADGRFYFLEMNTRLQVEHPITEAVTGVDLVQWQFRLARGERLTLDPRTAADAARPRRRVPHLRRGSGLRLSAVAGPADAAARAIGSRRARRRRLRCAGRGADLTTTRSSRSWSRGARTRPEAIARMRRALSEYQIAGVKTTIPFFTWLLDDRGLPGLARRHDLSRPRAGRAKRHAVSATPAPGIEDLAAIGAALDAYLRAADRHARPRREQRRWTARGRAEARR